MCYDSAFIRKFSPLKQEYNCVILYTYLLVGSFGIRQISSLSHGSEPMMIGADFVDLVEAFLI